MPLSIVRDPAVAGEWPSLWVRRHLVHVRAGGHVLDVAAGGGRHTRLALAQGFRVTAVDRDLTGLTDIAGHAGAELITADLENGGPWPLGGRTFDGVIVTNYLWRPILPDIMASVAPAGLLIYETFAVGNERFGRPRNPNFLLNINELAEVAGKSLTILAYEHGLQGTGSDARLKQRIAACGPQHPLANPTPLQKPAAFDFGHSLP